MNYFKTNNSGQSLIEVVVAVGMMALLLTAILALVSLSVKNSRVAKDRAQAVSLAQEGVELMRTYRDFSWSQFSGQADGTTAYNLPEDWTVGPALLSNCQININTFFKRCVLLSQNPTPVTVNVVVSWKEGAQTYQTNQVTQLTLWER
ncbi:MAG: hypothetical protein NTZ93_01300 [Candidatus Beckwithbacteria bacterium]|nr:hypothetical protein [Candidatus Beckwithbacteria bacterium]